eukprot:GFYU01008576.1.p1 GENE.GFYU01008576.1~~GFYU01008576.1.p1  ORF type:complete len:131 (-),score=6.17 GFYU01008576.1:268-660(-)
MNCGRTLAILCSILLLTSPSGQAGIFNQIGDFLEDTLSDIDIGTTIECTTAWIRVVKKCGDDPSLSCTFSVPVKEECYQYLSDELSIDPALTVKCGKAWAKLVTECGTQPSPFCLSKLPRNSECYQYILD